MISSDDDDSALNFAREQDGVGVDRGDGSSSSGSVAAL